MPQIKWPKDQIEYAKERGEALFAVAVSGCHLTKEQNPQLTGNYEHYGPTEHELARQLFFFAHDCMMGMEPSVAFAKWFKAKKRKAASK